jgi:hypothetical protein
MGESEPTPRRSRGHRPRRGPHGRGGYRDTTKARRSPPGPSVGSDVYPARRRAISGRAVARRRRDGPLPAVSQRLLGRWTRPLLLRRLPKNGVAAPAPGTPERDRGARPGTAPTADHVYECAGCGTRALGQQRCDTCGAFSTRVGLGGLCPHCDEPVAIDDLVDQTMIPPAIGAGRR